MIDKEYQDDVKSIGTANYKGIAYFWHREYKHTMRRKSPAECKQIHDRLIASGLELSGKSEAHEAIIWKNVEEVKAE